MLKLSPRRPAGILAAAVSLVAAPYSVAGVVPVGALPAGPRSTISSPHGTLVAIALPQPVHAERGYVWRIARAFDGSVVREVAEQTVGTKVVLVFEARSPGSTTLVLAVTRGERPHAIAARYFRIDVT